VTGKKARDPNKAQGPHYRFFFPFLASKFFLFILARHPSPVTRHPSLIAVSEHGAKPEAIYIATAAGVGTMALDINDEVMAGEPGAISSGLRSFTQLINGIH
jgi:hypothetical protein